MMCLDPKIIEKDSGQSLDRDTNTPSTEKQVIIIVRDSFWFHPIIF